MNIIENRLVRNKARFRNCLDLGCGSGILGIYLLTSNTCGRVVFVDSNQYAIENTRENTYLNHVIHRSLLLYSDSRILNLLNQFDLVIGNPPYLPGEPVNLYDSSLLTGPRGYETIVSFIEKSYELLRENGLLYITYSSLSNTSVVESVLNKRFRVINKFSKRFFLEEIYVVEALRK